jgi:molecular chaperone GrpE
MSDSNTEKACPTCCCEDASSHSCAGQADNRLRYRLRRGAYSQPAPQDPPPVVEAAEAAPQSADTAELQKQIESLKDQYLRSRSDLENYRKRVAREKEENIRYANESLIKSLLETVDNLERVIQGAEKSHDVDSLHSGVALVHQQFVASLQRHGVEVIAAEPHTKFDPLYHEAVMVASEPGFENDTIIECLQPGYTLSKRVLRAAMVKVAKK